MSDRPLAVVTACVLASLAWVTTFTIAWRYGMAAPALAVAGTVIVVLLHVRVPELRALWRPSVSSALWGLAAGGALVGATYALFPAACTLVPALEEEVRGLYQGALGAPNVVLATVAFVAIAEEAIWRGALLGALRADHGSVAAVLLSAAIYAAAQAGAGSVALVVAAFCLGVAWGALALFTRGLFAPLVAHLIWTPTVLVLLPLTATP